MSRSAYRWRGVAVGAAMLAGLTVLKLQLWNSLGAPVPFLLYFGAVLGAAWYGGNLAGLVTTAFAAFLGNFIFFEPSFTLNTTAPALLRTAAFFVEGILISVVTTRLQTEIRRSAQAAADASLSVAKLEGVLSGVADGITMQDASGRLLYANDMAARMTGFASAAEMLGAGVQAIMERFETLREDGTPLAPDELPGRILLRGGTPGPLTVRFRVRASGEERWSVLRSTALRAEDGQVRFLVNVFEDVTESRRREQALRLSREWLATALRSIGDGVITTDRDARVTFLNPVAEELTGWKTEEAAERPLGEVFHILNENTRQRAESPVDRVLREGVVVGLANHTLLVRKDGSERALDDSAAPIRTETGELVGVVLVFRDVSEGRKKDARKAFLMRATTQLNSSLKYEETLATVAQLAVPAIADWCAVDMLVDGAVKRLAVAHIDPAKIELVGEIQRRYPPDPNAAFGVPNILRTGQPEMVAEIPDTLLDGLARDAEHRELIRRLALRSYIGVPIKHGGRTIGAITLAMAESQRRYDEEDRTFAEALGERAGVAIENAALYREAERLRADAAVQRDRLHAMIMASPTAICVLRRDPELRFELINEPYRSRLGPGAVVGGKLRDLGIDAANLAMLHGVFDTGQPFVAHETPVSAAYADGYATRYLSYTVQPLRDATGQIDRLVIFTNDLTEQVLARKRLEAARTEAELASRSKDEFLAMLGHELRNPLAPILTALQLMNLRAGGALERERSVIERQVKHVVRLVDDLLDVSRITRGKVELSREIIEVSEVVARAIEMASPLVEERQHELVASVDSGLYVDGDPVRLSQIVANVINNAAKYTEKGGHISVRATRSDGQVVIRVQDDGMGIAPEMLPRVFDLFVQERQALDRAQGGLGLGLAIVRSLVHLHGGTVEAHSDGIGKGAELVIRLPAAQPAEKSAARPAYTLARAAGGDGRRILLVDDNADALELLATSLEFLGYQTLRATDGPSALVLAAREKPTLALLDIGLPVMDGYELARRLRETQGLDTLKLIALTGYGQPSDRDRSAAAGFDAHLVKPVTIQAVQAAIERLH